MSARDVIDEALFNHAGRGTTDAILSALTAAGLVVEQGWQPVDKAMDSRAKNGPILGLCGKTIVHLKWFPGSRASPDYSGVFTDHECRVWLPSHWRPLPAPPETTP